MRQDEVATSILFEMSKHKIKHPKFTDIIILLQEIKDDKPYRYSEQQEVYRKLYNDSTKIDTL